MKPIVYPAVFHKEENAYLVEFPDLPGCITYGNDLIEAFLMAGDALKTWLCDPTDEYPAPRPYRRSNGKKGISFSLSYPAGALPNGICETILDRGSDRKGAR